MKRIKREKNPQRLARIENESPDAAAGFTIIELLVAMSIFVVVTTVAVGIFKNALRGERRLVSLMSVQSNISSALEEMAREVRGGYLFEATSSVFCASTMSFLSPTGQGTTTYALSGGGISRNGVQMTGADVKVDRLCFAVNQYDQNGRYNACSPWRITILASAEPAIQNPSSLIQPIPIQTTVSSRVLPKDMPPSLNANNCQ